MEGMKNIAANLGIRQRTPDECDTWEDCERKASQSDRVAAATKANLKLYLGSAETARKWRVASLLAMNDFHPDSSPNARTTFAEDQALNELNNAVLWRDERIRSAQMSAKRLRQLAKEIRARPEWKQAEHKYPGGPRKKRGYGEMLKSLVTRYRGGRKTKRRRRRKRRNKRSRRRRRRRRS